MSPRWSLVSPVLAVLAMAVPVAAEHGAWWRGFGTATNDDGTTYDLEFFWGGEDAILTCSGGGCVGAGDGYLILSDVGGLAALKYPFAGIEDTRDIFFTVDPAWCANDLEIVPDYELVFDGGALQGIERNCLGNGTNKDDFTGFFLTFDLVVHSEGRLGESHG